MLDCEFIPAVKKDSRRLMVVLHGLGDSSAGFRWMPEMLGLPWMNYLLVNAPTPYYVGFSWYDFFGDMAQGLASSRKMLFELLDEQRGKGFPTEQTVLLGFSQGCLMTIEAGARYPHLFAGLVGISGHVYEPERMVKELSPVAKEQRFLITHGFQDSMIPFAKAREQFLLLKGSGLNISWVELNKAHTVAGEAEVAIIRDFIVAGYPKV